MWTPRSIKTLNQSGRKNLCILFEITFDKRPKINFSLQNFNFLYIPKTFPTAVTAATSVFEYKNLAIAHSLVEAEHTVLPVQ